MARDQLINKTTDKTTDKTVSIGNGSQQAGSARISGLEALIKAQADKGFAPVDQWDPTYCGDIGMAIKADGSWHYQGSPIGRAPLVKLFASVLRRDADNRHYLVTPVEKIAIAVADAPFLAVEMQASGTGAAQMLTFRTNVDDIVSCGPEHPLRFMVDGPTQGVKPYVLVRGRLEALVSRALYYDLVALAVIRKDEETARDVLGVWSGGAFFVLADADGLDL